VQQYLNLLQELLDSGNVKGDRTGTGTLSKFGHQMRFDLQEGLPLLTTKKLHLKSIIHELLWFLKGDTNIKYLQDNGVTIWDEWADENGDLGPVYGRLWRAWPDHNTAKCDQTGLAVLPSMQSIDQISEALETIKNNPNSRRIIVTAWNPADIAEAKLPPCHCLFQFYVHDGKLSCQLYQRSCDSFLGIPYNLASYALLAHMFAQQADLQVGYFIWTGGDVHLYSNHIEQAHEQLKRQPKALPQLRLNKAQSLFDYTIDDFEVIGYDPYPSIKAPVAV